jgi:hypothetical protein
MNRFSPDPQYIVLAIPIRTSYFFFLHTTSVHLGGFDKLSDLVEIQQWVSSRTIVHRRSIFHLQKRNAETNNYLLEQTRSLR